VLKSCDVTPGLAHVMFTANCLLALRHSRPDTRTAAAQNLIAYKYATFSRDIERRAVSLRQLSFLLNKK